VFPLCSLALGLPQSTGGSQESDIDTDEVVTLFPALGRQTADGLWEVPVHGWIFEPENRVDTVAWFVKQLGITAPADPAGAALLARRAAPFLVDNERDQRVPIRVGAQVTLSGASHPNGHFFAMLTGVSSPASRAAGGPASLTLHAVTRPGDTRVFRGVAYLLDETGVSVVSDIDDTIKLSHVRDKAELLQNTFLRPFRAVEGMAKLYGAWAADGAAFHYVSSSPWQLIEPLEEFRQAEGFPAGSFHLRTFRLQDESFFSLFESPERHKIAAIGDLIRRYPTRRFVLTRRSRNQTGYSVHAAFV
jgi:hypothetical protein